MSIETTHRTAELAFGSSDFDEVIDGPGRGQCAWQDAVCPSDPTHYVVWGAADEPDGSVYCGRHYVLTLAHMQEVHLPDCGGPLSRHIVEFGSLDPTSDD